MRRQELTCVLAIWLGGYPISAEEKSTVSDARRTDQGVLVHDVRSPYQAKPTEMRVLLPEPLAKDRRFPVVYVLPVEAGKEARYGDGLMEVKKLELQQKYQAIFVLPTFSHLPWYADHPTKPELRQESYLIHAVLPFIEKNYPTTDRYLLGFSKSGWGAWSLLLRHPDLFKKAVAWDAPMMMDKPGKYGSGEIFGTQANFEKYCVRQLLKANRAELNERLILMGHGNFRTEHEQAHSLLNELKIAHLYRDGPLRKHDWHSGWVGEAVELLLSKESRKGQK